MAVVRARKAEPQKVVITRDVVTLPAIADKMMDERIGYVKVEALTKGQTQDIATQIKSLEKSGAKKFFLISAIARKVKRVKASRWQICS